MCFVIQILCDQIGWWVWLVYCLDCGIFGVLLFGLSSEMVSLFGWQFEVGMVEKCYWVVVCGYLLVVGSIDYVFSWQCDVYEFSGDCSSNEVQLVLIYF